jgi:hypothetical protein
MPEQLSELDRSEIILRRNDSGIVAGIPKFALFAHGDTVQAALEALDVKKNALKDDIAAFGATVSGGAASQDEVRSLRWDELKLFAVKSAVVFGLLFIGITYVAMWSQEIVDTIPGRLQATLQRVAPFRGSHDFWAIVERELDRAADPAHDLSPEKKEKLLSDIRIIAERWRPFVAAAAPIFDAKYPVPLQSTSGDNPPGTR